MMKKIAIVHDNLLEYGGSERVLEELLRLYPTADLYTFFFNATNDQIRERFGSKAWRTSVLQRELFLVHLKQYFSIIKPLAWWYFSHLDLRKYDLVVTSSHSYNSKSVRTNERALHVCYLHTPPRFLYGHSHELSHVTGLWGVQWVLAFLRKWDRVAAQEPDVMLVNSSEVQQRVKKEYGRTAIIVSPPVKSLKNLRLSRQKIAKKFFIVHSRLVKQKNVQLLIETCTKYNLPLKVIGEGYLRPALEKIAGPTVEFVGFVPDRVLVKLYQSAIALLYAAQDEDFGIVPIEAQSAGVPVIAYRSGALKETVKEGKTGYFFDRLNEKSVFAAIQKLEKQPLRPAAAIRNAQRYSVEQFRKQIRTIVKEHSR